MRSVTGFGFAVIGLTFPVYLLWKGRLAGYLGLVTSASSTAGPNPNTIVNGQSVMPSLVVPNPAPGINATPGVSY